MKLEDMTEVFAILTFIQSIWPLMIAGFASLLALQSIAFVRARWSQIGKDCIIVENGKKWIIKNVGFWIVTAENDDGELRIPTRKFMNNKIEICKRKEHDPNEITLKIEDIK